MPGKPPIDRIRATDDAPGIYADHIQRFAELQAAHCGFGSMSANYRAASLEDATQEDA